jgi:hypothetical protein
MKSSPKKNYNDVNATPHNNKRKAPPKKNKADATPKNEVKEMFMNWFKKRNTAGQVMTKQDVVKNILTKLDAKQNDAMEKAINELKSEGWIEIKEDGVTLALTEKGVEYSLRK